MANWKPTEYDKAWTINLLSRIKHNGVWAVPMSQTTYRVDKVNKRLVRTSGIEADVHERTKIVCNEIGWRVVDDLGAKIIDPAKN